MTKRYILSEHAQGTPEWLQVRAGKATGSRASDVLATIKSGESAARRDYRIEIVTERLTGQPTPEGYVSPEMIWGREQEPFARLHYEDQTGILVREVGFAYLPNIPAGCSVDGMVEDEGRFGLLGIKCPKSATHLKWLQAGVVPPEHIPQANHELWITGAQFFDFVSFDPRMPGKLRMFKVRLKRDEKQILAHEAAIMLFLAECKGLEESLRKLAA